MRSACPKRLFIFFKRNFLQTFPPVRTENTVEKYSGLHTAVHFITCVPTVDHLVTTAVVGDTASIFALELPCFAQCHCKKKRK